MLHKNEVTVKKQEPAMNIFFLPMISANRPKGTNKTAVARRYAVITQLREMMVISNSFPIAGRQRSIERPIKGAKKLQRPSMNSSLRLCASIAISPLSVKVFLNVISMACDGALVKCMG